MPFVHVHVPEGTFSQEQKQAVVSRITDVLVEVEQVEEVRPFVTVLVSEVADGGWGVAGTVYTRDDLASGFGVGPKPIS
jgi:4-oxalocrotonate tautomerase